MSWLPVTTTSRFSVTGGARRHRLLVDHADLECRRAAEDLLGARDVLDAGQLNDDAVGALLLDHRLGHPELVDAVMQSRDVLPERAVLDLFLCGRGQRRDQTEVGAGAFLTQRQLAQLPANQVLGMRPSFRITELDLDRRRGLADARMPDVLFAQQRADVGAEGLEPLVDRGAHVDLQQEVHATAQVEPEIHR